MTEREIFSAALNQPDVAARAEFLLGACGGDVSLRQRVESLLAEHQHMGNFMETTCFVPAIDLAPRERAGMRIGPYKLLQQIGEGGFGVVFQAVQTEPVERQVALKVIKPGMDTRQVIARFEAEKHALALMDHVNIARALDAGITETGRPFFVMELVHGVPITTYCDEHQLTPHQRLELFLPVCHAIQHAHQKGVIHRDIKPSNVIITLYDGQPVPKVIDFGVAKATEQRLTEQSLFTQCGAMIGTLEYMSPEQAEMSAIGVDTRSDIYSLGVLLYELLTGNTPLSHQRIQNASLGEILRMLKEQEPPKPSVRLCESGEALAAISTQRHMEPGKLAKLVRGELDWIVMKTLEKDRRHRYETASGLAADLQRYLHDEPVQACPPAASYRLRKFTRRNRGALLAAGLVATALMIGTVTSGLLAVRAMEAERLAQFRLSKERNALKTANHARRAANVANEEALSDRDRAIAQTYRALLGETRALREARPMGWRTTALANLRRLAALKTPSRDPVELRSEAIACLGELDAQEIDRFVGHHTHLVYGLDFSADGQTLATAGYDGRVCLWNLGQRRPAREIIDPAVSQVDLWGSGAPLPVVRFRPAGNGIAYSTWSRQVAFFDAANDGAVPPSIESQSPPRDIVFDQMGRRMAISWGNGQVGIYDASTGDQQRMVDAQTPETGFYMRIALSPSGDLLATRGPSETIQLFQLDSDAAPRVVGSHGGVIRGLAFSGDGQLLASASEDRTAKIWTVRDSQEVVTLQGHTSKVISIAFSPEDDMIATGGDDGTLRLWEAQTGRPLLVLNASMPSDLAAHGIQAVAFSKDGSRVAAASQAVSVYEIRPRRIQRLPGHGLLTTAVAFHPQRPIIATSSKQQDVTFWNRETGRELHRRDGMAGMPGCLSFSGDGSLLAVAPLARVPTLMIGDDVSLLESETGRIRHTFAGCFSSAVAFDPTGRMLAVGDRQGQVWLFDPATGELQLRCSAANGWITDVAFLHDGTQLVIGDVGGQVLLWDLKQNRQIGQAALPGGLFRLTVDPPQGLLAVANFMNEVRILSLPDLRIVATLGRADEPAAVALAFRNDGKWLAVGGADCRVTIWDTRSFDRSFTMPTMNAPVLDLAFQSDGSHLAVATADELIPIWDYAALEADLDQLGLLGELPAGDRAASRRSPSETAVELRRTGGHQLIPLEWSIWLLEHMLEIEPEQPQACMELAWLRVMGPKAFRDSTAALPLAQRAVKLAPNQAECLNTLGVVYYRLGRWDDAINTLQAAASNRPAGASGSDLLFLAMSYHKGGRPDVARVQFERAIHWWNRAQLTVQQVAELTAIQVEAKVVLQGSDDPPAIAAHHLAAGRNCANLRLWKLAAHQFDLAVALAPSDPRLWDERGQAYAHLGQWPDAVRCFANAVELNSGNVEFWYHHAIACAGAEDLEGYRRICAAMVDRFRGTNDAGTASRVLYACVVVEGAGADSKELVRLAKIAVPWFRGNVRVLGAALCRDGQVESAMQRFDELDSVHTAKAWDWLFRAMCHARLNQPAQARQCMERAEAWIERADQLDIGNSPDRWVDWFERVELRLLRIEIQELLKNEPSDR